MHSEYYININSWFWCWADLAIVCFGVEYGSIGAGDATVRGNVIERSLSRTQCDIVSLPALGGVIWVYFFRNRTRLAKLAIWVELWSIGTAIDRLAVVIHLIQITLSLTLLTHPTCPIIKLQLTKHTGLTDNRVIGHLLLA